MEVITAQSALITARSPAGNYDEQVAVQLHPGDGVVFHVPSSMEPLSEAIAICEVMIDEDGEFRVMIHSDAAEGSECVYSYQGEQ